MECKPVDWPDDGPLDLSIHDLPHASSTTEWWYINGHCVLDDSRRFSYFAAFFRRVQGYHRVTRAPRYAHSLIWAIHDLSAGHSTFVSRVDQSAAKEGLRRLRAGLGARDRRLDRALTEVLERGSVPKPDVVFDGRVSVATRNLELEFAGDSFIKSRDGTYTLKITLPIAKAMARSPSSKGRKWLFDTLQSKPREPEIIARFIDNVEECGALEDCAQQARSLIEAGWKRLAPTVEDSLAKMMLRAFGWYVIERHY